MTSSQLQTYDTRLPKIEVAGLATRLGELRAGECLTLIGVDRDDVGNLLRNHPNAYRSALLLESVVNHPPEKLLSNILNDLADLALNCWPRWYGKDDATAHEILEGAKTDPLVSAPWLRAAAKRVSAGLRPRFRKAATAIEFVQLMRAIDPAQPVLVVAIDPAIAAYAAPVIQVLEWCASQGASVVATFSSCPPFLAPYDRILYGALEVVREAEPAQARFIPAHSRAHHMSAVEQRMEAALRRDAELAPLFSCNETVMVKGFGPHPRVDLLWREGRVVVELDGPDHQDDQKFEADRHRDYELLMAGYLVLRITNRQVDTDLQLAIEKIREVVKFRRQKTKVQ